MFFNYPPEELLEPPRPRPVFARVDQIEPLDDPEDRASLVLFDCIEAEWLTEIAEPGLHLSDTGIEDADNHISIVMIAQRYLLDTDVDAEDVEEWYYLEFSTPDEGLFPAEQYHNLFQDPTERGVINVRRVTDEERNILTMLAGWHDFVGSDPEEIRDALSGIEMIDAVAIYDVGQGAATALLSHGVPKLYFDIGGSTIGNWRSFPAPLRQFCLTREPIVVLSHWDWDHWSSALRDHRIMDQVWILPVQREAGDLGGVHSRFLAMLKARSAIIFWWDDSTPVVNAYGSSVTISNACGPKKNRNESGLVLSVEGPHGKVLLPGDASLNNCCWHFSNCSHLMVPHHGGRTSLGGIPQSGNTAKSHLVYSYGVGNIYLHPLATTVNTLRQTWKRNRHTALRDYTGLGHVGIDLVGNGLTWWWQPPCGSQDCQLQIRQWI